MESNEQFASGKVKSFNKDAGFGYIELARGGGKTVIFYCSDGRAMAKGQAREELRPTFTEERISAREPKEGEEIRFILINSRQGPKAKVWGFADEIGKNSPGFRTLPPRDPDRVHHWGGRRGPR